MNGFKIVQIQHIAAFGQFSKKAAYHRMFKLIDLNLVEHKRIFHGEPGIYQVTPMGTSIASDDLPAMKSVNFQHYHHDMLVTDIALALCRKFSGSSFISERRIRREKGLDGFGQLGHVADGIFCKVDGSKIAIEVELTLKGERRREKILREYLRNMEYQEVWYFCGSSEILKKMKQSAKDYSFIKILPMMEECYAE